MMILDLDDFQKLNDEEGRMFGDAILAEVADILKTQRRSRGYPCTAWRR